MSSRRYRVILWLDETGGPTQVALAVYVDDVKTRESTYEPGPFDSVVDAVVTVLQEVEPQQTLW